MWVKTGSPLRGLSGTSMSPLQFSRQRNPRVDNTAPNFSCHSALLQAYLSWAASAPRGLDLAWLSCSCHCPGLVTGSSHTSPGASVHVCSSGVTEGILPRTGAPTWVTDQCETALSVTFDPLIGSHSRTDARLAVL